MGELHITEKNYIRFGVSSLNHAFGAGLTDVRVAAISPADIDGLKAAIVGIATAHEVERSFLLRHISQMVQKLFDLTKPMATPVGPSGGNFTTATSGGSLLDNTAYFFRITAIDRFGNESLPSAEITKTTGAAAGADDNTITLKNVAAVDGAASYRVYTSLTTAVYTGYQAVTKALLEGATGFVFLALASNVAGTLPTTNGAKTSALSTTEIAAAVATGTFAALLAEVTEEDTTVDSALDRTHYVVR